MSKLPVISQAPGRINIIGEHTDYNGGFVFPAAIDKTTKFELETNGTESLVQLVSASNNEVFEFDLNNFSRSESVNWANYLMGVTDQLLKLDTKLNGFKATFTGNVPIGSGVSSSAALECSFVLGLNKLFDLSLDQWQMIKAAQLAEHTFVGTKCGIMDQFASMMGKNGHAILLDCQTLNFEYVPVDLDAYSFLLIDTKVKHELSESEYNTRKSQCEEALSILSKDDNNIQSMRDISVGKLESIKDKLNPILFKRVKHVVTENQRVLLAKAAMQENNIGLLGQHIYASHKSLSEDYEVSCNELDLLVKLSFDHDTIKGSRMMGGGFGGCTINLIKSEAIEMVSNQIAASYFEKTKIEPDFYQFNISDGAKIISS